MRGQDRQRDPETDDDPEQHRHADRQPDKMPDTHQCEGQPAGNLGRAAADAEELRRLRHRQARLRQDREARRHHAVDDDDAQAARALLLALAAARADLQHFGGGVAFGIGQVRIDDERAA